MLTPSSFVLFQLSVVALLMLTMTAASTVPQSDEVEAPSYHDEVCLHSSSSSSPSELFGCICLLSNVPFLISWVFVVITIPQRYWNISNSARMTIQVPVLVMKRIARISTPIQQSFTNGIRWKWLAPAIRRWTTPRAACGQFLIDSVNELPCPIDLVNGQRPCTFDLARRVRLCRYPTYTCEKVWKELYVVFSLSGKRWPQQEVDFIE